MAIPKSCIFIGYDHLLLRITKKKKKKKLQMVAVFLKMLKYDYHYFTNASETLKKY